MISFLFPSHLWVLQVVFGHFLPLSMISAHSQKGNDATRRAVVQSYIPFARLIADFFSLGPPFLRPFLDSPAHSVQASVVRVWFVREIGE